MKVTVVMPAYHAARALAACVADIPKEYVDEVVLVDDASQDATVELAKKLGLLVFAHRRNRGEEKNCSRQAVARGPVS